MLAVDQLIKTAQSLNGLGINQGKAGNVSVRDGDGFWLTPSAVPYEDLGRDDIVYMHMDGTWKVKCQGRRPSSEWRFHLDIMKARPDVGAVVHTHPPASTALACLRKPIPAFHYMVAIAGGKSIPLADYHTFGSDALSQAIVTTLGALNACLLANHGMIACGKDAVTALGIAVEVEALADQYLRALSVGQPVLLDDAEMDHVLAKFAAGYGYETVKK